MEDDDLRKGYDQIINKVEWGIQEWDEVLGEHLHKLLNYRVNVLMRENVQANTSNPNQFTKVENKKNINRRTKKEVEIEIEWFTVMTST